VLPNFEKARSCLEKAAYHGDPRAAMLLGQMYRDGIGAPADQTQAYAWSEVATLEGSAFAQRDRDA
jgi:TPR repeat protein